MTRSDDRAVASDCSLHVKSDNLIPPELLRHISRFDGGGARLAGASWRDARRVAGVAVLRAPLDLAKIWRIRTSAEVRGTAAQFDQTSGLRHGMGLGAPVPRAPAGARSPCVLHSRGRAEYRAPLATFPASLRDDEVNLARKEQDKRSATPLFVQGTSEARPRPPPRCARCRPRTTRCRASLATAPEGLLNSPVIFPRTWPHPRHPYSSSCIGQTIWSKRYSKTGRAGFVHR